MLIGRLSDISVYVQKKESDCRTFIWHLSSGVDSGGAGGSEKGQSLISACQSLAITASTSGFQKLSTALLRVSSYRFNT